MDRSDFAYASCYCEENVWHLAQDQRIAHDQAFVVFVSNKRQCCPMWSQRSAPSASVPAVWDYHVVLLARGGDAPWMIYDLDSTLPFPVGVDAYLAGTFPFASPPDLAPMFRIVERAELIRTFASDRSHMREGMMWKAPPPPWPPIQVESIRMNLFSFVDMERPFAGEVISADALLGRFGAKPR
jgi:hypothetical protein